MLFLIDVYYGDSCTSKLHVLVVGAAYGGHGAQVLADEFPHDLGGHPGQRFIHRENAALLHNHRAGHANSALLVPVNAPIEMP